MTDASKVFVEIAYMHWLVEECGYIAPRPIGGGRYAAIRPLLFTHAIIVGQIGDECSVDDQWCYHSQAAAKSALDAWDGRAEPDGWHRHPMSGRRREVAA